MTPSEILKKYNVVAVVGLSPREDRPSYRVASYLKNAGYKIIPVNPGQKEILGEKCYASLDEIPERPEIVDVFRRSEDVLPVAEGAVRKGAKVLWLQEGVINPEAAELAVRAGLEVVTDKCMLKEHVKIAGDKDGSG